VGAGRIHVAVGAEPRKEEVVGIVGKGPGTAGKRKGAVRQLREAKSNKGRKRAERGVGRRCQRVGGAA